MLVEIGWKVRHRVDALPTSQEVGGELDDAMIVVTHCVWLGKDIEIAQGKHTAIPADCGCREAGDACCPCC